MNRTRNAGLLLSVVYAVVLFVAFFSYLATQPWHAVPELGGDAIKNTFAYLYHSMYGKGYWFEGMNYPYGEHIVYTDGMPFISVIMAAIPGVNPELALTVLWWTIAFSYILAVVYVYKTLTHYKVNTFISVLFAGLIVFFSPQLFRLRAHYGLSFACVIPMIFYWTIQYLESSRLKYCLYIFLLGSITSFMHPYHAGLLMIWAGCYTAGLLLFYRSSTKEKIRHLIPLYGAIAATLVVVAGAMKLTDPLKDRPAVPYNSPDYYTHLKQLLISGYSPLWQFIQNHGLIRSVNTDGEGYAYAGLVCLATVGIAVLLLVFRKLKVDRQGKAPLIAGFPLLWLLMAALVLLLSMGGPMLISPKAINYLSLFKQFRSLGRFSWVYYYIITIFAVVAINYAFTTLKANGRRLVAYVLLIASLGFWAFEASGYLKYTRGYTEGASYNYDMVFSTKEKNWSAFLNEHGYNRDSFQAVVILPYFHVGTDKLWVGDPGWEMTLCSKASLQLQLPMINVMMARSSWSQAEKQVRIAGGPLVRKEMFRDLTSAKPILLLYFDEVPISPDEESIFKASNYIGQYSQCKVYAAYPEKILAYDQRMTDSVAAIAASLPMGDTCIDCKGTWFIKHFDAGNSQPFHGAPPMLDNKLQQELASIAISPLADSQLYELSAWFLLNKKDYRSPDIKVELLDSAKKQIGETTIRTLQSVDNYGLWFRAARYFKVPPACRYVNCVIDEKGEPSYLAVDELQLRPASGTVISKTGQGQVLVNNHLLAK